MNLEIVQLKVQEFLQGNEQMSSSSLALKGSPFPNITIQDLVQQLVGRQKARLKLPTWYGCNSIYYPPSINLEQTSSEKTAHYKAQLTSGKVLVDATGGLGVDSYYFSKRIEKVFHCELNKELQQIATHNLKQLEVQNVNSYNKNGIEFALQQKSVDWLYIDPSRRNENKGKVFFLEDCLPNVPQILKECLYKIPNILIKTAPILDISVGLKSLCNVKEIHIVGVNNEVKELLWVIDKDYIGDVKIIATSIEKKGNQTISFLLAQSKTATATYGMCSNYIYEPYSVVMKSGGFAWVSQFYNITKLGEHTQLYTSKQLVDFPGRSFKVNNVLTFSKKTMNNLVGVKANVVVRNFKLTVAQLRKKYKIKEGLERYLFFITDINNKFQVIDCTIIRR